MEAAGSWPASSPARSADSSALRHHSNIAAMTVRSASVPIGTALGVSVLVRALAAAVIGREFSPELIDAVLPCSEFDLNACLDQLVASELVFDEASVRARLDTVGAWSR